MRAEGRSGAEVAVDELGKPARVDDGELLRLAKAGDKEAGALLFWRYRRMMLGVITKAHRVRQEDAEDLLQGLYGRFVELLPRITFAPGFFALAAGWASQNFKRDCRRETIACETFRRNHSNGVSWSNVEMLRVRCLDVRNALRAIGQRCRDLLRAIVIERVPYRDFSEESGMPMGSIRPTVLRCLAKMKEHVS